MVHNVEFSCSHISFVWLHGLNSLQWWLLTCPDLTNVVWFKNNIDRHEYPKQLQAHPAKKSEIPDTRNTRWFWKKIGYGLGITKNYRVGSGIGYPSGPGNLKAHLQTHSGEKTFIWTKCNYCCTTAGSLKTHLLSFGRKTFQLHTVWILLHNNILPQETHVDAFRREASQVWQVQLFMRSSYRSQEPQAHPHCRTAICM